MKPYALIDLHCDTLTACDLPHPGPNTLDDPQAVLSLSNLPGETRWAQCFAIFVPDELSPAESVAFYQTHRDSFRRQMALFSDRVSPCRTAADIEAAWAGGKTAAVLTVENGSALGGSLERAGELAADGVRMLTLTWNGVNEIGAGNVSDRGLTEFGRALIPELERLGILADVSHLNDRGFFDLLERAERPFVASHSNARAVCPHSRNLTDDQIRAMAVRRCLIGLNFCNAFLCGDGKPATLDDLFRHIAHFLELGAEDCLALGSDFDGCPLAPCLSSPEQSVGLYGYLQDRGISPELAEKILFRNALEFFRANLR